MLTPIYDLDGNESSFAFEESFVVFQANQKIHLSYPAFFNTLKVYATAQTENAEEVQLTVGTAAGTTYCKVDDQADIDAKAEALNKAKGSKADYDTYDPTFANVIQVNAFGSSNEWNTRFRVRVVYQRFKMGQLEKATAKADQEYTLDGEGPRYSPALMYKVLQRLDKLENTVEVDGSMFGASLDPDDILDEDLTGVAPENYVQYERHDVNTSAGINLIQPARGSFYPTNLQILTYQPELVTLTEETYSAHIGKLFFYTDTESVTGSSVHISKERRIVLTKTIALSLLDAFGGKVTGRVVDVSNTEVLLLEKGKDYEVDEIDIPRTARSTNTNGVYQIIRFLTTRVGQVLVSYQAFGGFVSPEDVRAIHQDVKNTREILSGAGLITEQTFELQPYLIELNRRMRKMEEYHNHFYQVEHKVSIWTPGFHWFNIAAIYDVDWGTAIKEINDIGQFRIHSALRKWNYEFMVDVDMNRPAADALHIKTLGTNQFAGFDPSDYKRALFRDQIACRLCWVDDGSVSGVVLQIGWDFTGYQYENYPVDTDTILVTNKSGSSSRWTLVHDPEAANYPSNGLITVYNHAKYTITTDTTFKVSKPYYKYTPMYVYVKTADTYVRENKTYFLKSNDSAAVNGFLEVGSDNPYLVPGQVVTNFDGSGGLFERILYGRFPKRDTSVSVGSAVPENTYYEAETITYDDEEFALPNGNMTWGGTRAHCYKCVKMIEPEDGIIAWMGNIGMSQFGPSFAANCKQCDDFDYNGNNPTEGSYKKMFDSPLFFSHGLQKEIDPASIRAMTLVIYDRRDSRYLTVTGQTQLTGITTGSGKKVTFEIPYCSEDFCWATVSLIKRPLTQTVSGNTTETGTGRTYRQEIAVAPASALASVTFKNDANSGFVKGDELIFVLMQTFMGTMSLQGDRFDLRQIRLHF